MSETERNDLTFDFDRTQRIGFPEIVYGEHKSAEQLQGIITTCQAAAHPVFISRLQPEKAAELPGGRYNAVARIWTDTEPKAPSEQQVAVVSAGTADAPVVEECVETLSFLGMRAVVIQDVGVAGIHRLLSRLEEIQACEVVICVAGFEGALASVLAGQVAAPVIGVPTSVGYGVADKGQVALNAMLASCANGLMVMNVDNGVGAALAARRILRVNH